jgi:hypothetical protein
MKLRIKDNSLRLRLTQSEVIQLGNTGVIESSMKLPFGTKFTYALHTQKSDIMKVTFDDMILKVVLPEKEAASWIHSDQVGIEASLSIDDEEILTVCVEKDFKCLTIRPNEDESDHFENPGKMH